MFVPRLLPDDARSATAPVIRQREHSATGSSCLTRREGPRTVSKLVTMASVAISCKGGGSHTAFTAGVLQHLLAHDDHRIVAVSGTSGGANCALLRTRAVID